MKKILFQGDSITDCGRGRDDNLYLGHGYPNKVSGVLGLENPGEYEFVNRAVSGNRIVDLYARIKCDILNVKPDIMSIHIGVNDVWHELSYKNGVDADKFEMFYDMLIKEVKEALPNIKIILLGAYVVKSTATEEKWDIFSPEVKKRADAAKRVAEKYGCEFVPLQEVFDKASKKQAEPYLTAEGVHPSPVGHELIAREWLKAFDKIKD